MADLSLSNRAIFSHHTAEGSMLYLSPAQLRPRQKNHRKKQNELIRLAESIKKYGILEPLTVKQATDKLGFAYFELIDGHKRHAAAILIGLEKLPCILVQSDDPISEEMTLINKIRSENRHFFDLATAFSLLITEYRMTQEEIAHKLGLSQSAVANKLRLLKLSEEERAVIRRGELTERHARALLRIKEPRARRSMIDRILFEKLGVSATEAQVEALLSTAKQPEREFSPSISAILPESHRMIAKAALKNDGNAFTAAPVSSPQESTEPPSGVIPRKFAMRDLRPLYNSIDRTLNIFRKTGNAVECTRLEEGGEVKILISIPRQP